MSLGLHDHALLARKLTPPHSYAPVMARARLLSRLDAATTLPLTLVTAPAGSGKTTLVSDWLRVCSLSASWLSLERNDATLPRFWRYVVMALEQRHPAIVAPLIPLLPSSPTLFPQDFLTALVNALMDLSEEFVLILDSYEAITTPVVQRTMAFWLEHMPPRMHLILLTRSEPPLPLSLLRVRSQISELHTSDLNFTAEEVAQYLRQTSGLTLQANHIATLHRTTEGWAAGLQMAVLALQGCTDLAEITRRIHTFTGTHKYVEQYLAEEVLASTSQETQTFLFLTSILRCMHPELCDTVLERKDSAHMLEELEHANLFTIALTDHNDSWYHYHPLFADFLRRRLNRMYPQRVPDLHQRASQWYAQQHMIDEAVEHALAASDFAYAADLLERYSWELIMQGQSEKIFVWCKMLAEHVVFTTRPYLAYLSAMSHLHAGDPITYEQELSQAETIWREHGNQEMLLRVLDLRCYVALFRGDGPVALELARQVLQQAQEQQLPRRRSQCMLGAAYLLCGDLLQAHAALLQSQHMQHVMDQPMLALSTFFYLGELYRTQGRLSEACEMYQRAIHTVGGQQSWLRTRTYCHLGEIYCELDDVAAAEACLQQARQLEDERYQERVLTDVHLLAAQVAWLQHDPAEALSRLDRAQYDALRSGCHRTHFAAISALRIQYAASSNKCSVPLHWSDQYEYLLQTDTAEMLLRERELMVLGHTRILLVQHKLHEALTLLEGVLPLIQTQGRVHDELPLRIVQVQAYAALGDTHGARQALERALTLAEPGGYLRIFLDAGETITALLVEFSHRLRKRAVSDAQVHLLAYTQRLLNAAGYVDTPQVAPISLHRNGVLPQLLPDPLSEREQMVLKLLVAGLSNAEIARTLVVAESTVKTHLNNIYAKLHVNSRLQALTVVHTHGLIG